MLGTQYSKYSSGNPARLPSGSWPMPPRVCGMAGHGLEANFYTQLRLQNMADGIAHALAIVDD